MRARHMGHFDPTTWAFGSDAPETRPSRAMAGPRNLHPCVMELYQYIKENPGISLNAAARRVIGQRPAGLFKRAEAWLTTLEYHGFLVADLDGGLYCYEDIKDQPIERSPHARNQPSA